MALRTITPEHEDLHEVSIHFTSYTLSPIQGPFNLRQIIGGETYMKWMDLDRDLVQLCETHAVCVGVRCLSTMEQDEVWEYVEGLLPGVTKGGMIRLVDDADL